MKAKKGLAVLLGASMVTASFAGCGSSDSGKTTKAGDSGKKNAELIFATYEGDITAYEKMDMLGKLKEAHPEISIKYESYKDSEEYDKAMKVRASANELPDIMLIKPQELANYTKYLTDLTDWDVAKKNLYTEDYKIDGKCYSVPLLAGGTYTFYWKDMFKEAGVEVPTTWPEFVDVAKKLQEYFGAKDPDFAAIAMGAKDEWADYPYMQHGLILSGKGDSFIWRDMAKMDRPFDKDQEPYKLFKKVYDLFTSGVCGKDPLGVGFDQTNTLFGAKKCGMISIMAGNAQKLKDSGVDITELGSFFMPIRDTKDEPYNIMGSADGFIAVANNSKYPEACKDFIDFLFSKDVYTEYLNLKSNLPTMDGITTSFLPAVQSASDLVEQYKPVKFSEMGGDANYKAIEAEVQFSYKKLGTQFFIKDFDFDKEMERLNTEWTKARKKLNIQ